MYGTVNWAHNPTNVVAAAIDRGDGPVRETWIATKAGVKLVDRRHKTMRHYTRRDGLPTDDIVAVYADRDGVWCLAAGAQSIAFCALDESANHWRTLQKVTTDQPANSSGYWENEDARAVRLNARALLAGSSNFVALTAGAVNYQTDTVARLLNKRTGEVTAIPWDSALRADNALLGTTSIAMQGDDTIWLGTNLGLLCWSQKTQRWQRYFADRYIDGLALDGEKAVWAITHPRNSRYINSNSDMPIWTLSRVSLADSQAKEWAPPANDKPVPIERPSAGNPAGPPIRFLPRALAENLSGSLPVAVSIGADGTVWTSHISSMDLEGSMYIFSDSHGFTGRHGGFERFEPTSERWTAYPLRVVPIVGGNRDVSAGSAMVLAGGSDDRGAMPIIDLPDGAVRPLATTLNPYSLYRPYRSDTNFYWMRQRFPEWVCVESPVTNGSNATIQSISKTESDDSAGSTHKAP